MIPLDSVSSSIPPSSENDGFCQAKCPQSPLVYCLFVCAGSSLLRSPSHLQAQFSKVQSKEVHPWRFRLTHQAEKQLTPARQSQVKHGCHSPPPQSYQSILNFGGRHWTPLQRLTTSSLDFSSKQVLHLDRFSALLLPQVQGLNHRTTVSKPDHFCLKFSFGLIE